MKDSVSLSGQEPPPGAGSSPLPNDAALCRACGRAGAEAELMSWMMDRRAGGVSWTCPGCAAANIRALEAKLEPEWW
ncbi:MAG: hypothetical protein ACJ74U_11035 [Jatrophihabitantaceae bacterium]